MDHLKTVRQSDSVRKERGKRGRPIPLYHPGGRIAILASSDIFLVMSVFTRCATGELREDTASANFQRESRMDDQGTD